MAGTNRHENEIGDLVENWLNSTIMFWKELGSTDNINFQPAGFPFEKESAEEDVDNERYRTYKTWETSVNNFASILKLMMAPENREAMLQGSATFSEAVLQSMGESLENIADFQSQLVKSFSHFSESTKAYNYDDLDHSAFESFREFYKAEMQKYLKMPKIGLPREYCEQLTDLVDRTNIFASHLFELIYLFSLPFEKTNRAYQQRVKERLEQGEVSDDVQQGYKEWIKTLEAHFMELLKSPEYTQVLNNTITSLAEYKNIKNEVIAVVLKDMQIPTNKEMDAVYKEIYLMKKQIRTLTREVEALRRELQEGQSLN